MKGPLFWGPVACVMALPGRAGFRQALKDLTAGDYAAAILGRDRLRWLATGFKTQEGAAKTAGLILSYRVRVAEPRAPNDPDIYLVIEYKNWAALDGLGGKLDGISAQVEGSVDEAQQSQSERGKFRTILGSQTMQEALLR
jgi:hypothetical protein